MHRVARFVGIGVVSTLAYALLFLLLAGSLGSAAASAVALALTAVGNTAANRRFTFGIRGSDGLARQQAAGLLVFLLALALTNGALSVLHDLDGHAPRLLEAAVLVLATLLATVARYVALSSWVFRDRVPAAVRATPSCPSTRKEPEMSTTTFPRRTWPAGYPSSARIRSLVRGRAEDPAWARVALVGLLVATAVAYLWNLTASGNANSFYAAAVQAGTKSWKAFFFGSIDSSNFITVDKPPASLWVMALSGRIFGFSSASMLVPQVLEGVIAVGLLAASVKRWFGAGAGCSRARCSRRRPSRR